MSSNKTLIMRFRGRNVLVHYDQCSCYSVSLPGTLEAWRCMSDCRHHCRTSLHSHGPLFCLCNTRQPKILLSWGAAKIFPGMGTTRLLNSQRESGNLSTLNHGWQSSLLLSNRVCANWPRRTPRKLLTLSHQIESSSKGDDKNVVTTLDSYLE